MPTIQKICEWDSTPFPAKRTTAKFCSDTCRKAALRAGATPEKSIINDGAEDGLKILADAQSENKKNSEGKPSNSKVAAISPQTPPVLRTPKAELIARMNERLEAKGLPPIQEKLPPIEFVRTGYKDIDELTAPYDAAGWGGFPRKHITEVFGTKGAGKTSLMKQIVNFNTFNTDEPLSVLYVDAENGLINPPENVLVTNNPLLEDIEEMICQALDMDAFDLIIVDSVAMLTSKQEMNGDKEAMMAKPKAMSKFVRRVNAFLRTLGDNGKLKDSAGTAVVFINQLRDTGNSFGVKEFTPGGRALEYGASLRLELRSAKADKIQKEGRYVGQKVRVKIEKSRFNGEDVGTTVIFPLMFGDL